MTEFTASNGAQIILTNSGQTGYVLTENEERVSSAYLGFEEMVAWREFEQHRRDEELGRWRWPENPDYVVYPVIQSAHEMAFGQNLSVMVFHEPTGVLKGYCREEDQGGDLTREYPGAARAYFKAHPERKPWEDAKAGEVWVIEVEGTESYAVHVVAEFFGAVSFQTPTGRKVNMTNSTFTGFRKIWPEDAS